MRSISGTPADTGAAANLSGIDRDLGGRDDRSLEVVLVSDVFDLRDGEEVLHRQTASANGKSLWGGTLILTNQRVMFRPLDVGVATAVLDGGGVHLGPRSVAVPTSSIAKVEPGRDPGLFHPPSLVLTLDDGTRVVIGICASRFTPNFSRKNRTARDEAVALINAQLTAGGRGT